VCHRNNRNGLTPYASRRFDKDIRERKQPQNEGSENVTNLHI